MQEKTRVAIIMALGILLLCAIAFGQPSVYRFGALSRGNPLHYATLHFHGNATPIGISATGTRYRIKGFAPGGSPGWSYDPVTGELTATGEQAAGYYDLGISVSAEPSAGAVAEYRFAVYRNGSIVYACGIVHGFEAVASLHHLAQPCKGVEVQAGDVFCLDVEALTTVRDITVRNATVTAHRL
jgi:hypothetical protein